MKKPVEFDRIRRLLTNYAARLQDKNEIPPDQFLIAHAILQAIEMMDFLLISDAPRRKSIGPFGRALGWDATKRDANG